MNHTKVHGIAGLASLLSELCDYKRPVCYKLSEILVISQTPAWFDVFYQKDPQTKG